MTLSHYMTNTRHDQLTRWAWLAESPVGLADFTRITPATLDTPHDTGWVKGQEDTLTSERQLRTYVITQWTFTIRKRTKVVSIFSYTITT